VSPRQTSSGFPPDTPKLIHHQLLPPRHAAGVCALLTARIVARFQHFQQEFHRRHATPAV
jgi:hypothetical protein